MSTLRLILLEVFRRFLWKPLLLAIMVAGLAATLLACSDDAEPVLLATEGDYRPFNFINDDGEIDGLERELGDELCRRAGLECEWALNDWESMIPDLVAGEFDAIMAGMSITDKRDMTIDFTEPYYPPTPSVYLALSGAGDDAVEGKLGAYANTIYSDYFTERGIAYVEFNDEDDRLAALLNGDIDAMLVDHAYATDRLSEYEGRLTVVGPSVLLDRGIGIGVRNDNELLAKLNSALASMKADGSLNELIRKWVGEDASTF
ncbi:MAG: transporter substrate-binding domain-containing protein [Chloroflexota bacterium]|nr:transporter substrate-binding domain-containing protein [Chloroflexota bacterium]MDE3268501.1 transporter substrate-binding domain-containing protein [Chloroflexota bacterium]